MRSPFPGMDPYLEGRSFRALHHNLITEFLRVLARRVYPRYVAHIEEYVYLVRPQPLERTWIGPDVFVGTSGAPGRDGAPGLAAAPIGAGGTAVLEAPLTVMLPRLEPFSQNYLEIRTAAGDEVVCVLEVLSPTNKDPHTGRDAYLGKRARLLQSSSHLVELDLLRGGSRLPMAQPLPAADYFVLVSRLERRPDCGVWPLSVRDRLPTIPIPLAGDDADVALDLQAALDAAYDTAFFGATLDYRDAPDPPLAPTDLTWAQERIQASAVALK